MSEDSSDSLIDDNSSDDDVQVIEDKWVIHLWISGEILVLKYIICNISDTGVVVL